jgi:hypothetical protein
MGNRRGRRPLSTARPGRRRDTHVLFIVGLIVSARSDSGRLTSGWSWRRAYNIE